MNTYLLTWNPAKWPWPDLGNCIQKIRKNGVHSDRWSCGHSRKIVVGDRVFLIRQGQEPRGIVGSGWVASPAFDDRHWDKAKQAAGQRAWYILVDFDMLLDADREPILPRAQLNVGVLGSMHWDTQTSGITIPDEVAKKLQIEWKKLLKGKSSLRGVPKARRRLAAHLSAVRSGHGQQSQVIIREIATPPTAARNDVVEYDQDSCD